MKDESHLKVQLKYWRKRRGMNIRDLASKASVSSITISRIETGKIAMPRADVIDRLTRALEISVEQLIIDESEAEAELVA